MQKLAKGRSKLISVSEETYHKLSKLGDLEDSFDSVIRRLMENKTK